jgi:hypothetical protein
MPIKLTVLLFFCLSFSFLSSQNISCGTVVPPNSAQLERTFISRNYQALTTCLNKTLSLHFIVVTDSLNNPGITVSAIQLAVQYLNTWYAPVCLSFQICKIDTVYSYKYNKWHDTHDDPEFRALYCQENMINIALVSTLITPAGKAGYAPLGNGPSASPHHDLIVLMKGSIGNGSLFPHEMGHFFGLYHTFETSLGVEFVNESNCSSTGDLLCDTPADINPAPVSGACVWTGTNRDPNNDLYTPMLGNIMSYHNSACPLSFTTDQYNRIIFCYLNFRNYLY